MLSFEKARDYVLSYIHRGATQRSMPPKNPTELQYYVTLDDFRSFLDALENPQRSLTIVHVAGTNGKGSTSAMIASILSAWGLKVGLYTSPHLQDIRERIQIDGQLISQSAFAETIGRITPQATRVYSADKRCFRAFGQLMLAAALDHFRHEQATVAVIETGYGGRFDNTNVLDAAVSVLTPIGLDHRRLLGPSIDRIAWHKAGIIKPDTPVVSARQTERVAAIIQQTCIDVGAPLTDLGGFPPPRLIDEDLCGSRFRLPAVSRLEVAMPMAGLHQRVNAHTAAFAAMQVAKKLGVIVDDSGLRRGLANVRWPGRFEVLGRDGSRFGEQMGPESAGQTVFVLDGAHNPPAMSALAQTLRQVLGDRPLWLVVGVGASKAGPQMLEPIVGMAQRIWCTHFAAKSAQVPATIAESLRAIVDHAPIEIAADASTLMREIDARLVTAANGRQRPLVLFTGSLFLVGEIRDELCGSPAGSYTSDALSDSMK